MFNLGFGEILVICVILIIVVGPERLPTLMKTVGKGMRTVREASREIRATVGIDEMLRDDARRPVRPKVQPPPATVQRASATAPASAAETPSTPAQTPIDKPATGADGAPASESKAQGEG